eukprot:Rhum_TRINITY_DN1222_c0_g1::Rhum_TRINITY_DN1222_c0_g1_i1::g.3754::m.3754
MRYLEAVGKGYACFGALVGLLALVFPKTVLVTLQGEALPLEERRDRPSEALGRVIGAYIGCVSIAYLRSVYSDTWSSSEAMLWASLAACSPVALCKYRHSNVLYLALHVPVVGVSVMRLLKSRSQQVTTV